MTAHACTECGMLHDAPVSTESAEVAIARINAESALAIAKLQARTDVHQVDTITEAEQEIAEIETGAIVAAAAVEGEIIAAEGDTDPAPTGPDPIILDAPAPVADDEPEDELPVADDEHQPTEPRKSRGLGMW